MSHSIKVTDKVYNQLQSMQFPRESYNEVIERLIRVYDSISGVAHTLGPAHYLKRELKEEVK